ncbi:conserved hypothetical protein [Vibrio nigripulchritudo MADA3029]|uniref:DUF2897 domain-containing protein n=2 Tax=Vibrio nigripulchritudo TaxID=28173 RepID=U4K9P4_9VIBR|nr:MULTISPECIES: DUF2897 family protein [Vibrio]EGU52631.1 hypothetical protein VINI7043_23342 [Vibrio nigripulchritudo ATCC 27043]KJY80311.1 hypothetical protein TW74_03990 [Vibrio nigripulchritudo]UAB71223.1 DUF2897 family protein [Vibrio sp. SCSIO 43132]CCN35443.1 conserved hypothetical protein [Vibrio nigripulchritudo AM115]CCN39482.1 conserved hypothetical protein [Vibrio nigripulchritudo FTn2]
MEFLTNPWVIIIIVLAVVIGNIAALKYTAKMKFTQVERGKSDLDKLNDLDKDNQQKKQD